MSQSCSRRSLRKVKILVKLGGEVSDRVRRKRALNWHGHACGIVTSMMKNKGKILRLKIHDHVYIICIV